MRATPAQVRATRKRLGLTLTELGEALGVDRMTVHRWEAGSRIPPPYLWRALAHLEQERTHDETQE